MTDTDRDIREAAERAAAIEVIRLLSPAKRLELCHKGQLRLFKSGEDLIREGDATDFILMILQGSIAIIRSHTGTDHPLTLAAPVLTGEIAAYAGRPRMATVRAREPVTALQIERGDFLDAIRFSAEAGVALTDLIARRICAPDSMRIIGRYAVDALAGQGGSGSVFRCRDRTTGAPVALKMLSHALALLPGATSSFFREAEMLGKLDNPSIIRVLETFTGFDTCFIAMPWIEGCSLRRLMDDGGAITAGDVRTWTVQLLHALDTLHRAGMAHCDLKPSNILIDANRRAVLIDLGAGCFLGARDKAEPQFNGSPLYASPEQIMGRAPDGRSDIYSLCCTLYEVIFGHPPFDHDSIDAIMHAHLRESPSFDRSHSSVAMDEAYLAWLQRGMKRGRTGRPDAAASLAAING